MRSMGRKTPLVLTTIASLALCACGGSGGPATPERYDGGSGWRAFVTTSSDVLFVVDSTPGAELLQTRLAARFADFTQALLALPSGMPDLHVGVVASDVSAATFDGSELAGCSAPYADGALSGTAGYEYTWTGTSAAATRKSCTGPTSGAYLSATGGLTGEGTTNYGGTMADAFACIATVGTRCSVAQPLKAAELALGALGTSRMPAANAGFLRSNAALWVIFVSQHDDCSLPDDSQLFADTASGPRTTYRCATAGVTCDSALPAAGTTEPVTLSGCKPAESTATASIPHSLLGIAEGVAALKALKPAEGMVQTAALTGPASPFVIAAGSEPSLAPSCTLTPDASEPGSPSPATPAVRLSALAAELGGNLASVCASDLGVVLKNLASGLAAGMEARCVPTADADGCSVKQIAPAGGTLVDTVYPRCAEAGGTGACWEVTPDPICASGNAFAVRNLSEWTPGALLAYRCPS